MSIASKKGLIAAAGPDTLVIAGTDAVREAYHSATPAENNIKPFTPQVTLPVPRVSQVAFSADESCLVITAEQGGGLAVYDVLALLQGTKDSAFQMSTNGTSVRALHPNPTSDFAHLFAVVLSDGKLLLANLKEKQLTNVFSERVSCVSWSPKGKQLVAGLEDGTAVQYDQQGNQKAQIPKPVQITDPLPITSLCWIANDVFLTIHTPLSGDESDSTYHIIFRDSKAATFASHKLAGDLCAAFGMPRTPAHHFIARLRDFPPNLDEMLILASTAGVDVGLVTKSSVSLASEDMATDAAVNTFNITLMADDTRRAQMPTAASDGMSDTSPVGMALDLSAKHPVVKPIPQDDIEASPTPLPAIMLLNNEGLLCTWWIVYSDSIRKQTAYPGLTNIPTQSTQATAPAQPSPAASTTTPAFGQPPATSATPAFGQPTFGSPAFAKPASSPAFGAPAFGKPAAPAFGSPSTPGAMGGAATFGKPAFGAPSSIGGGSGAFGAASGLGNKSSPWGTPQQAGGATFGQASKTFGTGATGPSGFASLGSSAAKPAFASQNDEKKPTLQSPFSSFGKEQNSPSPFGQVAAATADKPSAFGSFGQNNDKPSAFGSSTPQPSFGSTASFPSTTGGSFGSASTVGPKPSPWGTPAPSQQTALASKEASMSDDGQADPGKDSQETLKNEATKPVFGQASSPAAKSPFANLGGDKPKTSVFGQASDKPATTTSPFAKFAQSNGDKPAASTSPFAKFAQTAGDKPSIFGQASDKPATSLFGQPSDKPTQPVFGKPSGTSSGLSPLSGFKLGSTFQGDGSGKDDVPPSKDAGNSMFGSAFGNMLGEAAKEPSKEPTTPIKQEPDADEPEPHASTTPATTQKGNEPEKEDDSATEPEEAPLPPDFAMQKPKPVEEDLPPIAGSPPVDLGNKSNLSSQVSSIGEAEEVDDDEEDNEEDDEEDDEEDEDESEDDEEDDEDEDDVEELEHSVDGDDDDSWDDEDDDDEDGPNQDDTVSRPPKDPASNSLASRISFPSQTITSNKKFSVPSTTPAGLPKGPFFAPPSKSQESPRSPSPVRHERLSAEPPARSSSRQSHGKSTIAVPPLSAQQPPRPSSIARRAPSPPPEPEAGELSDDEDERIQEILRSETEPTKDLEPFIAHQDYVGHVSKPGIGGQIEKVYRDINSMIDTLGLNVRSLEAFIKGHETLYKDSGRDRSDLEIPDDWCLVESDDLVVLENSLGAELENGKVGDVNGKIMELNNLYKEATRLRTRTSEMRKQITARSDPHQRAAQRASQLNTEVQTQQAELRQGVSKVQKLLQDAEEALSILRVDLATASAATETNGTSTQRGPTVEAITNTIMKMTAMIEQKSGDVDLLEAQIRRLPRGIADLSLEDEPISMRSSVLSLNRGRSTSPFATPSKGRGSIVNGTPLTMSGSLLGSHFRTPQASTNLRQSTSTYGLTYDVSESQDLNRSTISLSGSAKKKMSDVTPEEVRRYLAKQKQRKSVLSSLKDMVQRKGAKVTTLDK